MSVVFLEMERRIDEAIARMERLRAHLTREEETPPPASASPSELYENVVDITDPFFGKERRA